MPIEEYNALLQRVRGTSLLSLEEPLPSDKGYHIPLADTLKDADVDITASVEQRELRHALVQAVSELPPQERVVISLYYFEGQPLKDIKERLSVSESRVSQIHAQAVIHLRQLLRELQSDLGIREGDPTLKQKYVRKTPPGA